MSKRNKLSIDTSRIINPYPACVKDFLQLLPCETKRDKDGRLYRLIIPDERFLYPVAVSYDGKKIFDTAVNDWRTVYHSAKGHEGYCWVTIPATPTKAYHEKYPDREYDSSGYELVHRLVAKAFCPNANGYNVVHHIDFDKNNNSCYNLVYLQDQSTHDFLSQLVYRGEYDRYNKLLSECLKKNLTAESLI